MINAVNRLNFFSGNLDVAIDEAMEPRETNDVHFVSIVKCTWRKKEAQSELDSFY